MAEGLAPGSSEDDQPLQWKPSNRWSRKSGYSNIFSGMNMHQLQRLFRGAGDRNAENRAKLVWQDMDTGVEKTEEEKRQEEEREDEAGLAQALVGLRVRARSKTGIRVDGHRDHKGFRASGHLRAEEPLSDYTAENDESNLTPSLEESHLSNEENKERKEEENQSPFKPWRLGMRLDGAIDSERYLHRILH
ncbi:uncharacterized protein avpi1 [Cololabis saira]|uniref:uncharacterized protein avpi1 n=1 Tax=Cololabis saira TaxID=129043 RepID=UPI002AD58118|nr:uncharacterized protein avpi1 [Cololabis saira]XP_061576665.1 uncharacterized protein avpi1 [Cololabis saira]XP_061576666.1 uncharacterized protein avpi1 [Cololabis saira]XP_061576667.1 uncharacterized protein avpi1 [Cololabis saira]